MKTFDIILVNWNRLEYLKRTIASLIATGAVRDCERFIIVDNHSLEEGVAEFLEEMSKYKNTFIIRRPTNDGWGAAVNDALGLSRAEYVYISNNDVDYTNPGFHHSMLNILQENEQIGLLGVWRHTSHGFTRGADLTGAFRDMDNVPAVGWMLPKRAMEKVGMMIENGPCLTKGGNGEDTNYVMRMKEAGFLTGVPQTDLAIHIDGY
jgi:GT2 family glycosyltransferase